jgi:hypothetical protein
VKLTRWRHSFIDKEKENALQPLHEVVAFVMPSLVQLYEALLPNTSSEAWVLITLITKIFYSSFSVDAAPYLYVQENTTRWMNCFNQCLLAPISEEEQPEEFDERRKYCKWGAKKWTAYVLTVYFNRVGAPVDNPTPEDIYYTHWKDNYSAQLLESVVRVLERLRSRLFIPPRLLSLCIEYLDISVRHSLTWALLKKIMDTLFAEILFPVLCFTDEDYELWKDDAAEYCRKNMDTFEEFFDPRLTVTNFLIGVVRKRGKSYITTWMNKIGQVLIAHSQNPSYETAKAKHGALGVIGALSQFLMNLEELRVQIEPMMQSFVFGDFDSPFQFLRAKACWLYAKFAEHEWHNMPLLSTSLQKITGLLMDRNNDVPVRLAAALAVQYLCYTEVNGENATLPVLQPLLGPLLNSFLTLMSEIDSDDLVAALSALIEMFGEDIQPFALQLTARLVESAYRLFDADIEDETAQMTGVESLAAINTILESISHIPSLIVHFEPIVMPLLPKVLSEHGFDWFEEALKMVSYFTYFGDSISEATWQLFPLLINCFNTFASDQLGTLLAPLDNYISLGTERFLSNPAYMDAIFGVCNRVLTNTSFSEGDAGQACKLLEVVMQNCKGRVDNYLTAIIDLALFRLNDATTDVLKVLSLEVVVNAFMYNPLASLAHLESKGVLQQFFMLWFSSLQLFSRVHDKKLVVIALSEFLRIPTPQMPALIAENAKVFVDHMVDMCLEADEVRRHNAEDMEAAQREEDAFRRGEINYEDEDDDLEEHVPDDVDIREEFDENELKMLAAAVNEYRTSRGVVIEDDDELEDESNFTTPIDEVHEAVVFLETIHILSVQNPQLYQHLASQWNDERRAVLVAIQQIAAEAAARMEQQNKQ